MQLSPGGLAAEPSPVATELYYTPSSAGIGCKLPPKEGTSLVFHSCAPGPPVLLGSDHCLHPVPILKGPRSQTLSLWVKPIQLPSGAGSPRFGQPRAASGGGRSSNAPLGCRPNPKGSLTLCKRPDCHRETVWLVLNIKVCLWKEKSWKGSCLGRAASGVCL